MGQERRSKVWLIVLGVSGLVCLGLLAAPGSAWPNAYDGYVCSGSAASTLAHPEPEMRPGSGFFDQGRRCNHDARGVGVAAIVVAAIGVVVAAGCFRWGKAPTSPPKRSLDV
ncbi:MAG: hypothetical protein JWM05_3274 [Acidimicrobiales bacterium]|nr:hypothetical protein [Acidimicrobiales bacterium]